MYIYSNSIFLNKLILLVEIGTNKFFGEVRAYQWQKYIHRSYQLIKKKSFIGCMPKGFFINSWEGE